jgi:integrase
LEHLPYYFRYGRLSETRNIAEFRRQREEEGRSGNTIRLDFAMLSKLFNYARSDWGMESLQNPVQLAAKPRPGKARERRLEEGEEEKILKAAKPPFDDIIRFALETAMRREEIARMEWRHVNLRARSVFLPETKNSEARTVPLSPAALDVLKSLCKHEDSDLVFGVDKEEITHAMKEIRKEAEIEDLRFHDLRHEATSRFFENTDLDVMEIKAITGHKTLQMLARYTHLRTARLADRLAGVVTSSQVVYGR